MDQSIFGSYGIRGIWGETLDTDIGRVLGRAFAAYLHPTRVLVARDGRLSSPELSAALIDGLQTAGVDVIDIGVVPIDAFYHAVANAHVDGGAMITASHNPSQWNGVKFTDGNAQLLTGSRNKELGMYAEQFPAPAARRGSYEQQNVVNAFCDFLIGAAGLASCRERMIVVDPGNGATAAVLSSFLDRTPFAWHGIHMDIDGRFPGRGPNPKDCGALEPLARAVREYHADVGIAFDADGDRMFLVDNEGQPMPAEVTGILLAQRLLKARPGASFVYNVVCSHAVPELIRRAGGIAVRAGVGSVNMKPAIEKSQALMGIETAGHYILREYNYIDSGLLPAAFALRLIAESDRPLSELRAGLDLYAHDSIDLTVADPARSSAAIRTVHGAALVDELDGITVEYPDWWFNVRMSKTEPILRVTVESHDPAQLERRIQELRTLVQ